MELIDETGNTVPKDVKTYVVNLSMVDRIEVDGAIIYDRAPTSGPSSGVLDGALRPRVFEGLSDEERRAVEVFHDQAHYIVGDYNVHHDRARGLVYDLVVASGATPKGFERMTEAYADLSALHGEHSSGAVFVREAVDAILLGRKALELVTKDIGPDRQYEVAFTAVGVAEGSGFKGWGIDLGNLLQRTGGGLAGEIEARKDDNYQTLSVLQKGSPAAKAAVLEEVLSRIPVKLLNSLSSRLYAVDERLRPFVEMVAGPQSDLHFLPADAVQAVTTFATLLQRLYKPDPWGAKQDRFSARSEPLGFLANEIPTLVGRLGSQDLAGLITELRRIASATPRSYGQDREKEQGIRKIAQEAADQLEALKEIPWSAMDDAAFPKKGR
jgi:hypothetical protein